MKGDSAMGLQTGLSMKKIGVLTAALILMIVPVIGHAALYGFENITNNNSGDAAIGEAQLFVNVTDPGSNRISFRFYNIGPLASSITDIFFDDGSLLGIASIINGTGVAFSPGASPGELPGANNISPVFETTTGFLTDSDPPAQPNGVNPGEEVTILFDLINGLAYHDTIAALESGDLRIGIHVQGFASGGSESFVNTVPEPSTLILMGAGLLGLVWVGRKRFRK